MKINKKTNKLIEINNLSVDFFRKNKYNRVLKNISLDINEGEIIGIVGESGSGKTTLGRAIIGLLDHTTGYVKIDGQKVPNKRITSINKKNEWVFKKAQMIFQNPTTSLNQKEKVLNIISEGLKNFKTIQNEVKTKIEKQKIKISHNLDLLKEKTDPLNYFKEKINQKYNFEIEKINQNLYLKNGEFVRNSNFQKEIQSLKNQVEDLNLKKFDSKQSLKKQINSLKKEKFSKKQSYILSTKTENKYINEAIDEELNQSNLVQKETKPSEYYIKNVLDQNIAWLISMMKYYKKTYGLKNINLNSLTKISKTFDALKKEGEHFSKILKTLIQKTKSSEKNKNIEKTLFELENRIDWKSVRNTKIFQYILNYVLKTVKKNLEILKLSCEDVLKIIEFKEKSGFLILFEKEKEIIEKEILSLKYEEVLLKERIVYYEIFLKELDFYSSQHSFINRKNFYKFLISKNIEIEKIHISISDFKFRKKIERTKELLKVRNQEYNSSLLKQSISDFQNEIKTFNFENKKREIASHNHSHVYKIESKRKIELKNNDLKFKNFKQNPKEIADLRLKIFKEEKELQLLNNSLKGKLLKKEILNKVSETLSLVGLSNETMNNFPGSFSGGQQQRIGIARALVNKPKFIIADEPISALDVSVQAQVVNLLKELNQTLGLTIIFIAHDLEMINYISDRVFVLYKGDIVEFGDTKKVYEKPTHPYTRSLMNSIPKLDNFGKPLNLSSYDPAKHMYNEYTLVTNHQISTNHFVRGTIKEIKSWKK